MPTRPEASSVAVSAIDRVVAIDWSGRVDKPEQKRHIWAGVWTSSRLTLLRKRKVGGAVVGSRERVLEGTVALEAGRTRDEVAEWLIGLADETPRMVVGFDFCFSFPEWFVRGELGMRSVLEFWQRVTETHGERWLLRREASDPEHDPRFWGKPHRRPAGFSGTNLHRMLRATDIDCKIASVIPEAERAARIRGITPKSVFQIGGSGSVGTASLRGMPVLLRLHGAGFSVWPFQAPQLSGSAPRPLVVEMYTRLMTGPVRKANATARQAYLAQRCRTDPRYAALSRGVLLSARASEDAFDALVSCMVMSERRSQFVGLPQPRDPAAAIEGWTWAPESGGD